MTGSRGSADTRPISVAELLARNGTVGAPPPAGRRHRQRSKRETVTVTKLTGEIPVFDEESAHHDTEHHHGPGSHAATRPDEPAVEPAPGKTSYRSKPEPRWPQSRVDDENAGRSTEQTGAEGMNPDPLEHYSDMPVDLMDDDVSEAEPVSEDSAYVRSFLSAAAGQLLLDDPTTDVVEQQRDRSYHDYDTIDDLKGGRFGRHDPHDPRNDPAGDGHAVDADERPGRAATILRGGLVVVQSIVAVAFGAGLFIAFDELWRWNNIVALALSVLVILGLVVGVRVARRTEDIGSTLIAVAVGALVTLAPLALSQSG